jgi:UDP-N-acetylglucosamine 2-epimerase
LVGNSSSAIRDGSFVGVPAVNVGTRQNNRVFGPNVVHSGSDENSIFKSVKLQMQKKYKPSNLYGSGDSSKKIIQILKQLEKFSCQKVIRY